MNDLKEHEKKELESKIFAKRQQLEFEKTNIDLETEFSDDNRVNPDVNEEFKNFDDPAINAIDKGELKELSQAEEDLIRLTDQLNKLKKELEDLSRQ